MRQPRMPNYRRMHAHGSTRLYPLAHGFLNVLARVILPFPKKIDSTTCTGVQVCDFSSMHAPVVWHAWLSQVFLSRVV